MWSREDRTSQAKYSSESYKPTSKGVAAWHTSWSDPWQTSAGPLGDQGASCIYSESASKCPNWGCPATLKIRWASKTCTRILVPLSRLGTQMGHRGPDCCLKAGIVPLLSVDDLLWLFCLVDDFQHACTQKGSQLNVKWLRRSSTTSRLKKGWAFPPRPKQEATVCQTLACSQKGLCGNASALPAVVTVVAKNDLSRLLFNYLSYLRIQLIIVWKCMYEKCLIHASMIWLYKKKS